MYPGPDYNNASYPAAAAAAGRVNCIERIKQRLTVCFCICAVLLAGGSLRPARAGAIDWTLATTAAQWSNTMVLTTLGGSLYSIEKSGALYRTDLNTGRWVQVGQAEFAKTRFFFADNRSLYTIETDGSLYRVSPATGAWSRVGETGAWKDTIAVVTLNGGLYSIERSGGLYRTDLNTGRWVQLGQAEFANTRFIFADGQNLYTIEANGSLYRVSPTNGTWSGVGGSAGTWQNTFVGTTLNERIYTVERNGALYETDPATGAWKQIGKPEFGRTQFVFGAGGSLYSIEDGGGLYRINPSSGAWVAVGK